MDKVLIALNLSVEWDRDYLWISEEDGSGVKYQCEDPSLIGGFVDNYIEGQVRTAEYEAMEGNRDVY